MRRIAVAVLVAASFALVQGPKAAEIPPYQSVRGLQALEDRIATGDSIAQTAHAKAIMRLTRHFTALPPEVWHDPRNARALIAFLLSGGDAAAIAKAIPRSAIAKDDEALYEGALAYGQGDDLQARSLLLPLDAAKLPNGLAGHLALVQATLAEGGDTARALALLDLARLVEPGTLVEEAALRKEIGLIGPDGDLEKLSLLARRYQTAFSRSVYAANFKQIIATAAFHAAAANSRIGNQRLDKLIATLSRDDRRSMVLAIARKETIAGHLVSASFAAEAADRLAVPGDRDDARARLYRGASTIVGPRYDQALGDLHAIADGQLETRDQALHASALSIAAAMHRASMGDRAGGAGADDAVVTAGESALADADLLLGKTKP